MYKQPATSMRGRQGGGTAKSLSRTKSTEADISEDDSTRNSSLTHDYALTSCSCLFKSGPDLFLDEIKQDRQQQQISDDVVAKFRAIALVRIGRPG